MGSRGGISNSTPPSGSNRLRIASAKLGGRFGFSDKAAMSRLRASSSIERPCRAAWMRSLAFTESSSFRMVILATPK